MNVFWCWTAVCGTVIQSYRLNEADFRGERFADWPCDLKGNDDLLVLGKPEVVAAIHNAYFEAGADIDRTQHLQLHDHCDGGLPDGIPVGGNQLCGGETARAPVLVSGSRAPRRNPRYVAGVSARPTARRLFLDVNDRHFVISLLTGWWRLIESPPKRWWKVVRI
ncbi:homocysteine S-methyltransferase family protein [Escherichia coli]